MEPLVSLDRSTLRERALGSLRAALTSGQYAPGDHLGEVELAASLGVSRGTVREALRHLEQEGLVVAGMRGMLRVRALSKAQVAELFKVRGALEGLAVAEIVASPAREEAVRRLQEALGHLGRSNGDFAASLRADLGFHRLLCELSGNSMLLDSWLHLEGPMHIAIMALAPSDWRSMMSQERHAPIVEAIQQGDAAAAATVLAEHMQAAIEQYASTHA